MQNLEGAMDLRAVILDVDGTLVDSNDAHAHTWTEALQIHGYDTTFGGVRRLIGMGGDKVLRITTGLEQDHPIARKINATRRRIFVNRYLARIRPFPNSHALLSRMRADRLHLVVASSGDAAELKALLGCTQFLDLIEHVVSAADVDRSNPDPDLVDVALKALGVPASQTLMLGDTPYDIDAASKIGVGSIALRSGGWIDADLKRAVAVYDDAADLLAHYHTLPLARARASL